MGQPYYSRKRPSARRRYSRTRRRRRRGLFGIPLPILLLAFFLLIAATSIFSLTLGKPKKIQSGEGGVKTILSGQKSTDETETAQPKKIVMIDSGHGGDDPGCIKENPDTDIYEKDVNLAIAQKLKSILESNGYQIIMTRDTDTSLSLSARVTLSNETQPDLFVSIHQNSLENDTVSNGIETHYYDLPNLDSKLLAQTIQRFVVEATAARDRGTCDDSGLYVLKNNTVPACLVETGFLSAKEEGVRLLEPEYQERIAQGIAKGIQDYMEKREAK